MNIPEELLPVIEWWERDGKKTLVIVAVVGAAALAVWGWKARGARQRAEAAAALAGYGDAEVLQDAVSRFGSLPAGPMLKLKLAASYFGRQEAGDVEKALEIYEELCNSSEVPEGFADIPAMGRAECLEALERWDEALKAYSDIVAAGPASYLALSAKLGEARCRARAGDKEAAIAALDALKKESVTDSTAIARIDASLDAVKRWQKREPVAPPVAEPAPEAATPAAPAPAPAPEAAAPAEAPAAPAPEVAPEATK